MFQLSSFHCKGVLGLWFSGCFQIDVVVPGAEDQEDPHPDLHPKPSN